MRIRTSTSLACWICLALGLTLAAVLSFAGRAAAAWPPDESGGQLNYEDKANQPNDPGYGGLWRYWSYVPSAWKANVTEQNRRLGTGAHVDRAWAKTIGDRRVVISVLDSGANWNNGDLVNKWYLNRGELPAPTGCAGADGMKHDANGDGFFNVQDFTTVKGGALPTFDKVCDPRLTAKGDQNKNGILDPQDLIAAFSDGKDDDANGYKDDISGWDFFRNDNDAHDDTGYGHGDGEAKDSTAEGNNMRDTIGTCPECSVQALRVGDSFLADANDFGMATLFAVDSGSSVVQSALGTIDHPQLARDAIEYAYANNVAIIASAADENSFHHNFPSANIHTFIVHTVTHDAGKPENSTTFLNFDNCSNYGAQLTASVPGRSCSSEAVGRFAGMAGLVYSAALKANIPAPPSGHAGDPDKVRRLTAEEAYQIFLGGIDDLYDPMDAMDPTKHPTRVGWEQRFGYGRVNARRSVDIIFDGKIPPEVEIRAPWWFEVIYPERTPKLSVDGRVAFRNRTGDKFGDSVDWVLEWAPGIEPADNAWKTIAKADMMTQAIDGKLGDWDISGLTINNPSQGSPDFLVNRHAVTLRLRATIRSMDPKLDGTAGVARRAFFIHRDPSLLPGYPLRVSSQECSPKLVDLNGDGKREILVGDSGGVMHALGPDGKDIAGWPVRANLLPALDPAGATHKDQPAFTTGPNKLTPDYRSAVLASPAVGDIDGDKKPEVFFADFDGNLYAVHADGKVVQGWPQALDRKLIAERKGRRHPEAIDDGVFAAPAMADFDGDGTNEIVVADMLGQVTVWKGNGTKVAGYPVRVWDTALPDEPGGRQLNRIMSSPALGDLNKDGTPDIVLGTNEDYENQARLYALDGKTGKPLPGWPVIMTSIYVLPSVGSGIPNAPALADLNADGVPEIVIGGIGGATRILDAQGKAFGRILPNSKAQFGEKSNAKNESTFTFISNPAVGDLEDDGTLDVLFGTVGTGALLSMASSGTRQDYEMHLSAWDTKLGQFKQGFPQVMEDYQFFNTPIVADVDGEGPPEAINGSAGYWLHAFHVDGSEARGFPKFTGQWIAASPAVGDMDGDGKLEIAVGTRDGWLYAWHTDGKTDGRIDWESMRHDARNTGNFATPLDQGRLRGEPEPPGDCSCAVGGRGRTGAAGLALVALACGLAIARARRRARMTGFTR